MTSPSTNDTRIEGPNGENKTTITPRGVDALQSEFIGLGLFWDEWARCIGSRYQIDHLYRVGRLDTCSRQWKDLKIATRARLKQGWDPRGAQELLDSTYYKKRTTISPTAGAIWELKEKPGWD